MVNNRVPAIPSRLVQRAALLAAAIAVVAAWRERSFTKNRARYGGPDLRRRD